jgi:hypothetical protein
MYTLLAVFPAAAGVQSDSAVQLSNKVISTVHAAATAVAAAAAAGMQFYTAMQNAVECNAFLAEDALKIYPCCRCCCCCRRAVLHWWLPGGW